MNERSYPSMCRTGFVLLVAFLLTTCALTACGGGASATGGGSTGTSTASGSTGASGSSGTSTGGSGGSGPAPTAPTTPTGLAATAGDVQVALTWSATTGATSYAVGRSTTSGGPYTSIATPSTPSYTDTTVTDGTTYYYVVSAANSSGTSSNSAQVSATPAKPAGGGSGSGGSGTPGITINIDLLTNRHSISPYVYGGNGQKDAATLTDSGTTLVRWGGNASSTYNWQLGTYNADADWYYEDFLLSPPLNNPADRDSAQFIQDVQAAGSVPLTTMAMMDWVAQSQGASFSATTWPSQCKFDPYNSNAGNGLQSDCKTPVTTTAQTSAYYPLLDQPGTGDPANSVYRSQWAAALASAFGTGHSCPIPNSTLTSCHFYDMDNEVDIWGGTHRDIHPVPSGYEELRDIYLKEANALKGWDPAAVRLGPVSCCWWFYWNGANGSDKGTHGGEDFLAWWLNEISWRDQIAGTRSLDIFDTHAYPDGADTTGWTTAQIQALATRIYRDYWDPTYTTESSYKNNAYVTLTEPTPSNPFRIPRLRALVNTIYPGTPLAFTEWSAAFAGESDFSTALGDADAYGVLGRERVALASRWGAPDPANPNYQALKLYTNYDGAHHGFNSISVLATHNADPNLLSVYAATTAAGTSLTVMVLNKDPTNAVTAALNLNGFTPSQVTSYTLSQSAPKTITAGTTQAWPATITFQPYTATLLVITGTSANIPAAEWDLNPDTIRVSAGAPVTLHPKLVSGSANLTISTGTADSGITTSITSATLNGSQSGSVLITAGNTPGFYHFNVKASDGTTQGGWIVVGNPPASLANTAGAGQTAPAGTVLPVKLSVTLSPGQSGGSQAGASVLFTTTGGSLQNIQVGSEKVFTGPKVIALTNSSGVATVTMTLPATSGTVQVSAAGPYDLGHPMVTFTETAQ